MAPLILKVDARDPDPGVMREAAQLVRDGLVVAYPTDTLYGLAVDPRSADAVARLYELKRRSCFGYAFDLVPVNLQNRHFFLLCLYGCEETATIAYQT